MLIASVGIMSLLFAVYGQHAWFAGVIKIEHAKGQSNQWRADLFCGGPDDREINPAIVRIVYVDPKAKDPFTGRLLLDEMRELLKSGDIVYVRFNRKGDIATVTTIEHFLKLKLNVKLPP